MANAYAQLTDLKARLDITGAQDDAVLESVLEAASRQVDGWCGRAFASGPGTRVLTADTWNLLILPDDLHSLTGLAVDRDGDRVYEMVWELTDLDLSPYPGPYQMLRPRNGKVFPTHAYAIEITGEWGFGAEPPAPIREATLLQASWLFKAKDAPLGIAGTPGQGEMPMIRNYGPGVKELIAPYVRNPMVV